MALAIPDWRLRRNVIFTYREDIKKIIVESRETRTLDTFEKQLRKTFDDISYSEIKWNRVLTKVCNYIINKYKHKNVRFIDNMEIQNNKELCDLLSHSEDTLIINVSQRIKKDIQKYREHIEGDNLFIEDPIITNNELLTKEELNESQKNILEESVDVLKKVDSLKGEHISIDNIKISRVTIGSIKNNDSCIIIPLSSLTDLETCSVMIINILSSLDKDSKKFKDRIVGNLIKIIHERNMSTNNK